MNELDDAGSVGENLFLFLELVASPLWEQHRPDIPVENPKEHTVFVSEATLWKDCYLHSNSDKCISSIEEIDVPSPVRRWDEGCY